MDYSISSSPLVSSLFREDLKAVESKYEFAKPWDYRTTFTRNPPRSKGYSGFVFPPWAIALTFLIPIFILILWWVICTYCYKRSVILEPALSDTSSIRGKIDIGDVDDSATIVNEPGIIIQVSNESDSRVLELESQSVPLERTRTL